MPKKTKTNVNANEQKPMLWRIGINRNIMSGKLVIEHSISGPLDHYDLTTEGGDGVCVIRQNTWQAFTRHRDIPETFTKLKAAVIAEAEAEIAKHRARIAEIEALSLDSHKYTDDNEHATGGM